MTTCIPDPEDVEVNNTNPAYFGDKGRKSQDIGPITLQPSLQQDPLCRSVEGKRHHHPDPPTAINTLDYKPLEVPDHTFCRLCGSLWTHYVEKLTEERKRRTKDQWQPYQICKKCYAGAKKRAQQSATILPGTCDPARMERLTKTICRCTICDLDAAVYIDRGTGTKLCGTCYQRITAQQDHGQVTG